ncbi:catabolite repressor protein [Polychytrium aggregatum]|uniref:catabolite repressor protein n=1 Tax=Polychytrium aggregatum TaxID=110093 RepID=UPI0022FF08B8|nr:catabolite repressor protein [Polychytrium aggregatum]KAI9208329.1 catabolite repressor protein [Polychytrium aggregatum]
MASSSPSGSSSALQYSRSVSDASLNSAGQVTPPQDILTSFATPEGTYHLRDQIKVNLQPIFQVGSTATLISVKSVDTHSPSASTPVDPPDFESAPAKFVELPLQTDGPQADKSKFGFMSAKPNPKKTKPTSNKTVANFISKILVHDQLARILTSRPADVTYLFYNIGRSLLWMDYMRQPKDPLSMIEFKDAFITCHDINPLTRDTMDVVMGFNTGDVMSYLPLSGKTTHINRQGCINKSSVLTIQWLPGSETRFVAGYADGSLIFYDKDKDEQPFIGVMPPIDPEGFTVIKSYHERESSVPNPQGWWQISQSAVTAISFSPDTQHIAVVTADGKLKVIDFKGERICDCYPSYFGGFTCVCWSPDGKFIVTGGQDDFITIWNFRGRIVARCQGHSSWVTSVAFDPYRCSDRSYRFGSVGEDAKLCLWDFSVSSLHRPRTHHTLMRRLPTETERKCNVHELASRRDVSVIEPFFSIAIHLDPIKSINFREDGIITADRAGRVRLWKRPTPEAAPQAD